MVCPQNVPRGGCPVGGYGDSGFIGYNGIASGVTFSAGTVISAGVVGISINFDDGTSQIAGGFVPGNVYFTDYTGALTSLANYSSSGGGSGFLVSGSKAANNGLNIGAAPRLPWYKNSCITSALGAGAVSAGIDAIGLIPEAGGLARMIGHGAGYVGVVADQLGSRVVGAVGASTSTVNGLAGLGDTSPEGLLSTGLTVAGFIPGLGQAASIGSIIMDTYKTAKAISQCP